MKRISIIITLLACSIVAQTRSGLMVGVQYEATSHTNPYVYVGGNDPLNPQSVKGYSDNTSHFYFPFGYVNYSKKGYSEFSTYAFHLLFVGVLNLINPNKEYKYTTNKTYSGDSWADGYSPVLDEADGVYHEYNPYATDHGLEASYVDMDFLRLAFSGNIDEWIGVPLMIGAQGGIGNFGVHFAKVMDGHEPTELNNDKNGLVNFNETVDLYFGPSIGYVTEIMDDDLAMIQLQYDFYYFIKGTGNDEYRLDGNRFTAELTYFPFDYRQSIWKNLFFKVFYKTSTVPYMKDFADKMPTNYTYSKIGIGINYLIL